MNKSLSADHAFDLDAEPEPIPEDDVSDYDGGYDAMADGNDHGMFSLKIIFFLVFLCRHSNSIDVHCAVHCVN